MRQLNVAARNNTRALVAAIMVSIGLLFFNSGGTALGATSTAAVVSAMEGKAEVSGKETSEQALPLERGMRLEPWQTVTTDEKGKLMLRWDDGLVTSLGGFSSILLSTTTDRGTEVPALQVLEGLVRVATEKAAIPFSVQTPMASIQPEKPGQPVDFVVEVYEPTTTVVTVFAGSLRINKQGDPAKGEVVSACNTVYIEKDKSQFDRISLSPEDIRKLAAQATIEGTMHALADVCPLTPAVPPTARRQVTPRYAPVPEYEYIDEGVIYDYPWDDIVVTYSPTYRDRVICFIPGYGRFIIPYDYGYALDPSIWQVYVQYAFAGRALYYDRTYYNDLIYQQNVLNNALYLAAVGGNYSLWWDTHRQLRRLQYQSRWAAARINDLERRVSALENNRQRFAGQIPAQVNINNVIANSFNSRTNRNVVDRFENRLRGRFGDEARLAAATGQELMDFRSRLAREQDPQRRQELRNQFAQVRDQLDRGKVPIRDAEAKRLASRITAAKDSADRTKLQEQLVGRLAQRSPRAGAEQVLPAARINSLKQGIARFPDATKRPELEKRFTQLERSMTEQKQLQTASSQQEQQVRQLRDQLARERDPGKKEQVLRQLQQLGAAAAVGTQLRQPLQGQQRVRPSEQVQPPVVGQKSREDQRRVLEQLRQKDVDSHRQQLQQQRVQEQQKRQQELQQQRTQEQQKAQQERLQQLQRQRVQEQQKRQQQIQQQRVQEQQKLQRERSQQLQQQRQQQQRAIEQLQRQRQQPSQSLRQSVPRQWQQPSTSYQRSMPRQSSPSVRSLQQSIPRQSQPSVRSFQPSVPRPAQPSRPSPQQSSKGAKIEDLLKKR